MSETQNIIKHNFLFVLPFRLGPNPIKLYNDKLVCLLHIYFSYKQTVQQITEKSCFHTFYNILSFIGLTLDEIFAQG